MRVSIIGLGKLGAPMAAVMASKGHTVVGVDSSPESVRAIQQGKALVDEPGLAEMLWANRERLSATADCEAAVMATDVTFMMVPTPSGTDGTFSNDSVLDVAAKVGAALRGKESWHLVVLSSTVMPGTTGGELRPALEMHSGKRCGEHFGLCYSPEFIALGTVIRDMLRPELVLIGESDSHAGDVLAGLYGSLCESRPSIQRMNYVNAELAKLSVNTFVTTKISYANMLAQLCDMLPGADVAVVTAAIGCNSRIGHKYLTGALGYGGPCFPRDNVAFSTLARVNGVPALLAEATDQINRRQVPRLARMILDLLPENGVAGILGLSYKPDTGVVEESQGLEAAKMLLSAGTPVIVYDPAAMDAARRMLTGPVSFASTATECLRQADVVAIATPWPEFRALSPDDLKRSAPLPALIDCWRVLPRERFAPFAHYLTLGMGPHPGTPLDAVKITAAAANATELELRGE